MLKNILLILGRILLSLRYRIHINGMEHLKSRKFDKTGGVLFLPNHPSELDPVILVTVIPKKFAVRALVVEPFFYMSWVGWLLRLYKAIPMPDFAEGGNQYKSRKIERTLEKLIQVLKNKENLLFYPSGRLKTSGLEVIGGASGAHTVIQGAPEANLFLVRTKGLWGSSFSTYLTGQTPSLNRVLLKGLKILLLNAIFFTPRRDVSLEFIPAPPDFPYNGSKIEMNNFLEKWYNQPFQSEVGEPVSLVPYYFWSKKLPKVQQKAVIPEKEKVKVPDMIRSRIIDEIARIAKKPRGEIKDEQHFSRDLGMDSLDVLELTTFLDDQFDFKDANPQEMTTVGSMLQLVAKGRSATSPTTVASGKSPWKNERRPNPFISQGETIAEVFLRTCDRLGNLSACGDELSGVFSYRKLKMAALLLSEKISRLPEDHVGILLPASVGSTLLILACHLAKKIPVMINWTLGSKHLQEVVEIAGVKCILTSARFLNRAKNLDLEGIEDYLLPLEDLRREIKLSDKIRALVRSYSPAEKLLSSLDLKNSSGEETAVLLFTSGTESKPKGVPLSHRNILSNQKAALEAVQLLSDDIIYGFLPPFHSFGFTVTGLLGILSGLRVAYFQDPTDGPRMARFAGKWKVTIVCGAPTFLKNLLHCAKPNELKSVRLFVSGAEKTPQTLFDQVEAIGNKAPLIEGYGITECGPILTLNRPGLPKKGVGQPLPGVELMIVHPETLEVLPIGATGLVLARGPNIFSGYLLPTHNHPFIEIDEKQWYQTGDLGTLDEEGYLVLSGRLKRFVKIGGEMVNLNSVEDAIIEAAPKHGIQLPEEGAAFAICSQERDGEKTQLVLFAVFSVSLGDINISLKEMGFSNLIKISEVRLLPSLPLLASGKVNYRLLQEQIK